MKSTHRTNPLIIHSDRAEHIIPYYTYRYLTTLTTYQTTETPCSSGIEWNRHLICALVWPLSNQRFWILQRLIRMSSFKMLILGYMTCTISGQTHYWSLVIIRSQSKEMDTLGCIIPPWYHYYIITGEYVLRFWGFPIPPHIVRCIMLYQIISLYTINIYSN